MRGTGPVARVDRTLWSLIAASTVLSAGHHVDHILRDATGWPAPGRDVTPFTYSLGVYVAIALLVVLSLRGVTGPGAWAVLTGAGVLFVAAVHLGPAADDTPAMVQSGYDAWAAGALALGLLALQFADADSDVRYAVASWRATRRSPDTAAPRAAG